MEYILFQDFARKSRARRRRQNKVYEKCVDMIIKSTKLLMLKQWQLVMISDYEMV